MNNELSGDGESVEESDEQTAWGSIYIMTAVIRPYMFEPTRTSDEAVAHETTPW